MFCLSDRSTHAHTHTHTTGAEWGPAVNILDAVLHWQLVYRKLWIYCRCWTKAGRGGHQIINYSAPPDKDNQSVSAGLADIMSGLHSELWLVEFDPAVHCIIHHDSSDHHVVRLYTDLRKRKNIALFHINDETWRGRDDSGSETVYSH